MAEIVVLDGYVENPGDLSWGPLEALGRLRVYDRTSLTDEGEAIARIGGADIVVTNKTPITRRVLEACGGIRMVALLSTGYNVVDCAAARARGIPVCNVPDYGTAMVAQYAIGMLLELCGHVTEHSQGVHAGRWTRCVDWCYWDAPVVELWGKTMGIVGYGRIGRQVGRIAGALGMEVLAATRTPRRGKEEGVEYVPLEALLERSDVISLHCPLFPETEGIINRASIGRMKDGVMIVNNSRGGLVVEADLAEALNTGKVAGAAVDVVSVEPIRADNPLLTAKNCLITPHISWAAKACRQRILDCAAENIRSFLGGAPVHVVNGV